MQKNHVSHFHGVCITQNNNANTNPAVNITVGYFPVVMTDVQAMEPVFRVVGMFQSFIGIRLLAGHKRFVNCSAEQRGSDFQFSSCYQVYLNFSLQPAISFLPR